MRSLPLRISCALLFLVIAGLIGSRWPIPGVVLHPIADDMAALARQLNIRNLVSAVYLGPRVVDTFLEVMVVILAVVGMKHARESAP